MQPDICTSLSGCAPPQEHCPNCSHAFFNGELYVNGIRWPFEFNPQFGVTFKTAMGGELKTQPSEPHPVWAAFGKWHDDKFKDA
jgi:hypothetical protein